ncbi:hypothetical protein vBSsoS008_018 [Shigella phage vB_SsoS_008]|nr:hypothetical protein vBSsoS008_018 [Shigella phage vB_SsoS_008]
MFLYGNRRDVKELYLVNGKSPRQFMIWISEMPVKPQFGNRFFGMRAESKVKESVFRKVFIMVDRQMRYCR